MPLAGRNVVGQAAKHKLHVVGPWQALGSIMGGGSGAVCLKSWSSRGFQWHNVPNSLLFPWLRQILEATAFLEADSKLLANSLTDFQRKALFTQIWLSKRGVEKNVTGLKPTSQLYRVFLQFPAGLRGRFLVWLKKQGISHTVPGPLLPEKRAWYWVIPLCTDLQRSQHAGTVTGWAIRTYKFWFCSCCQMGI